jgi:glycosyltransferase involved in cell wall biosynthesis
MASVPRVSIITATYNWSSVLRYAIESVRAQTFQNWEMLVVGDGCTDDSGAVVASFQDERLRWHNLPQNSGHQSTPNNVGFEMARGQYVAYLGHDDIWHPTHLERLVAAIENANADLGFALAECIGPRASGERSVMGFVPSGEYERGLVVVTSSLVFKRAVLAELGGWKDYRTIQLPPDTQLVLDAFDAGKKFVGTNELTVFKFNASWRRNAYVEKPSYEQAEYIRRMQSEPDFLYHEARDILEYYFKTYPELAIRVGEWVGFAPRGYRIEQARRFRGLAAQSQSTPRKRWTRALLNKLRRGLKYALYALGDES